jgi:hypothetical protein
LPSAPDPFYFDWKFWSAVVAGVALVLSQFPPILPRLWPSKLEIDVHARIVVGHKVGNANVTMYVGLTNAGGRTVRISAITLRLTRDGKEVAVLPAKNFYEKPGDKDALLFVPFSLKAGEHWAHIATFLNYFDRQTEREFRANSQAMRVSIETKLNARAPEDKNPVSVEPTMVAPFLAMFDRLFVWSPGEYMAELSVSTPKKAVAFKKDYRFTLFESDTAEMKRHRDGYMFGAGVYFDSNVEPVTVALFEHTA